MYRPKSYIPKESFRNERSKRTLRATRCSLRSNVSAYSYAITHNMSYGGLSILLLRGARNTRDTLPPMSATPIWNSPYYALRVTSRDPLFLNNSAFKNANHKKIRKKNTENGSVEPLFVAMYWNCTNFKELMRLSGYLPSTRNEVLCLQSRV
jgi:hypothetical protein